jgi:hypothetical protein
LAHQHVACTRRLDNKQSTVQRIGLSILYGSAKHIEAIWCLCVNVVEHGATPQVIRHPVGNIAPNGLKKGMSGSDPFECGISRKQSLIEDDLLILAP